MKGHAREGAWVADRLERSGAASPFAGYRPGALKRTLIISCLCCLLGSILWPMRGVRQAAVPGQYAAGVEEANPLLPGASQHRVLTAGDEKSGYRATLAEDPSMWYGWGALTDDATRLVYVGAREDAQGGLSDPGLYVAEVALDRLGRPRRAWPAVKAIALPSIHFHTIRPIWLEDGNRVLYSAPVRIRSDRLARHIFLADVRARRARDLTPRSLLGAANPVYSEQAGMIAFTGRTIENGQRRWDIYTIRPDGTGQRRLTHPGNMNQPRNTGARWTEDGRAIVYCTSGAFYRIPADGTGRPDPVDGGAGQAGDS